ncbi:MAG: LysR family transcriptional regulator [Pseudomonadota bacterium]
MLDLEAVRFFTEVAERESFSGAARALGTSKSAVSKQVGRLEEELGARLLNRTTRRVSLTEAGQAFYQGALDALAAAEAARGVVTHLSEAPRGRLRISAPVSFSLKHLSPLLADFMARYPEIALELTLNDRRVDLVEEGFDLAIRIGVLDDSSLIARKLAPVEMLLCAAPAYLKRRGMPAGPKALADHDCLIYTYGSSPGHWRFEGPGGASAVKVTGRLEVNNGDLLRSAALAGAGIVLLPDFIVGADVASGALQRVLGEWTCPSQSAVYALYPSSRQLSPKVRVCIDYLAERLGAA